MLVGIDAEIEDDCEVDVDLLPALGFAHLAADLLRTHCQEVFRVFQHEHCLLRLRFQEPEGEAEARFLVGLQQEASEAGVSLLEEAQPAHQQQQLQRYLPHFPVFQPADCPSPDFPQHRLPVVIQGLLLQVGQCEQQQL